MRSLRSVAVLLAGVLTLLLATACSISTESGDSPGDAPVTNPDGFSLLTREGVDEIERTHRARFDLRERSVTRKAVGLGAERLGPFVGGAGDPELTLELVAPGATEEVRTSTFSVSFVSNSDRADLVTWFESYDSRQEADAALRGSIERWGLPTSDLGRWQETLELAGTEKVKRSTSLGVSPSGLVVGGVLWGTEAGGQTHQFQVLLDPRYYEPAALETIRRTGYLPPG